MLKYYFELIKPGIIFANLISVVGGVCFTSQKNINIYILFWTLIATICVIASGCVFNNIIDIDIDKKMTRTKNRVLVQSLLPIFYVKIYGILLLLLGVSIFLITVNILSCVLSIIGFIIYVFCYSYYMKRHSMYSVIVGSLSGAIPVMIGYCSITNFIDFKSILLFIIFSLWQIPHSYSIFIFRLQDYKRAKLPVISIQKGILRTIKEIMFYIFCFFIAIIFLFIFKYINIRFLIIFSIFNIVWFYISIMCYMSDNYNYFSRILFYWSILVITTLNIMLIINFI